MKRILIAATALPLLAPMSGAFAQGYDRHDDHRGNSMMMDRRDDHRGNAMMMQRHDDRRDYRHNWRKGGRIDRHDWDRGTRIRDYRHYHLSRPPRGYEWRRVDDNYVLAAVAGGLIASVIMASSH
jgi:Ni/Co efflux regulator RcnB